MLFFSSSRPIGGPNFVFFFLTLVTLVLAGSKSTHHFCYWIELLAGQLSYSRQQIITGGALAMSAQSAMQSTTGHGEFTLLSLPDELLALCFHPEITSQSDRYVPAAYCEQQACMYVCWSRSATPDKE